MDIKDAVNAIKVGDFVLRKDSENKIDIKYLSNVANNVLTDDLARVYIFVVDGIIKKIGGSSGKNGIKATMSFYINSMQGSPGVPRFVIHLIIAEALESGSKVELYMITSPKILATINGLFSSKKVEIASFKEMEDFCKSDYFSREGRYPDWNFQENHEPYPTELAQKHNLYHQNRLSKKNK